MFYKEDDMQRLKQCTQWMMTTMRIVVHVYVYIWPKKFLLSKKKRSTAAWNSLKRKKYTTEKTFRLIATFVEQQTFGANKIYMKQKPDTKRELRQVHMKE